MEERKENDINTTIQQQTPTQGSSLQGPNVPIFESTEKIKKSINHIGLIIVIISAFSLLGLVFSIVSTFVLPETKVLSKNPLLILTGLVSIITLSVIIFLANKLRKDDLEKPGETYSNLLIITLAFVLSFFMDLLNNGVYSSTSNATESEVTFSLPILEIVVLFVLIKGLVDLNKYMKRP